MEETIKILIGSIMLSWSFGGSIVAFLLSFVLYLFFQTRLWILSIVSFLVSYFYFQLFIHSEWLPPIIMAIHAAWTVPLILWAGKTTLQKIINRANLGG